MTSTSVKTFCSLSALLWRKLYFRTKKYSFIRENFKRISFLYKVGSYSCL